MDLLTDELADRILDQRPCADAAEFRVYSIDRLEREAEPGNEQLTSHPARLLVTPLSKTGFDWKPNVARQNQSQAGSSRHLDDRSVLAITATAEHTAYRCDALGGRIECLEKSDSVS